METKYRPLSTQEVIATTTLNCCANAIVDNLPNLERRLKAIGEGRRIGMLKGAANAIGAVIKAVLEESPDLDQRAMIINRMRSLKLQFGHTQKHPEDLIIMNRSDAETLFAPVLEKCDYDCPCVIYDEDGNKTVDVSMVKSCETRKAMRRVGLSEIGLDSDCPYRMLTGGKGRVRDNG